MGFNPSFLQLLKTVGAHKAQRRAFAFDVVGHFSPVKNAVAVREEESACAHRSLGWFLDYL